MSLSAGDFAATIVFALAVIFDSSDSAIVDAFAGLWGDFRDAIRDSSEFVVRGSSGVDVAPAADTKDEESVLCAESDSTTSGSTTAALIDNVADVVAKDVDDVDAGGADAEGVKDDRVGSENDVNAGLAAAAAAKACSGSAA
jgi:hypothetical protein